jgi:hypothetical protein
MTPGDRVIFWVSGPLTGRLARGIWGLGHVTGSPRASMDEYEEDETEADAEEPVADDGAGSGKEPAEGYWIDLEKETRVSFFVPIYVPLLTEPIKASDLLSVPATADIEVVAQPQGSNPSFISAEQLTLLTPHLPDWPETPVMLDEEIAIGVAGAAYGDPYTTTLVDLSAIETAISYYSERGWDVIDVTLDPFNYDLNCESEDGSRRHVEVKGVATGKQLVLITADELAAATGDPLWELALVTRALSNPTVRIVGADEVMRAATPYVYRVAL